MSLRAMCMRRFSGTKHDDLDLPSCKVDIVLQSCFFVSASYSTTLDQAPYDCDTSVGMPECTIRTVLCCTAQG